MVANLWNPLGTPWPPLEPLEPRPARSARRLLTYAFNKHTIGGMSPRKGLVGGTRDAEHLLPLTPLAFSILIALLEGDLHGYGIARRIGERDAGGVALAPGNLYAALDRLIKAGLLQPVTPRAAKRESRRREYRITPFGRDVARLEAERLQALLRTARRLAILP